MSPSPIFCKIEHHAVLFALLAKYAITKNGEKGKEAILKGMTKYGNERGFRMAQNALSHKDPLNTLTSQVYGEWIPDYEGQIDAGQLRISPTLQTYVSRCAWCDAWEKHHLLDYGKYYCLNIDNAVYQGFRSDLVCKHLTQPLSWGGECCEFDWGHPLTNEENQLLSKKKAELGTSCIKDFTFHTAHILHTISSILIKELGDAGEVAVKLAAKEYIDIFGKEYLQVLDLAYEDHPLPPQVYL